MNIAEAVKLIDRTAPWDQFGSNVSPRDTPDVDIFCHALGVNEMGWSAEFNTQVEMYYLESWLCTDTRVGVALYFFPGEPDPVAYSVKAARRSDADLWFIGNGATRIRELLVSLQDKPETETVTLDTDVVSFTDTPYPEYPCYFKLA